MTIDLKLIEGKNSISFLSPYGYFLLYEKLVNSIHVGTESDIINLHKKLEEYDYKPKFSQNSLLSQKEDKIDSLLLNVTEECDLRCKYCIYSGSYKNERPNNSGKVMSIETAIKAVNFYASRANPKTALIGFYGGEPTNNFELIKQVVNHCQESYKDKKFNFSLTTNFVNIGSNLKFLIDNNFSFNISLDGPQELHDLNRITPNKKGTYQIIMKNLEILKEIDKDYTSAHVGLNGTYSNGADFEKIINHYLKNEPEFCSIRLNNVDKKGLLNNSFSSTVGFDSLLEYGDMYLKRINKKEMPEKILRTFFEQSLAQIHTRNRSETPQVLGLQGCCYLGKRKLFVDTDGTFFPCEKFGRRASIGNIKNGLNDLKIQEYVQQFADIRNNLCNNCWAVRMCNSCIQSAKDPDYEISYNGLKFNCGGYKSNLVQNLILYAEAIQMNRTLFSNYFESQFMED